LAGLGAGPAFVSDAPDGPLFALNHAAEDAYTFTAPLRSAAAEAADSTLTASLRFVELAPSELVLTAVKPADSGDGIIIRFYNSSETPVAGRVTFGLPMRAIISTNLLEDSSESTQTWTNTNTISLNVPAKRIVTLRAAYQRGSGR